MPIQIHLCTAATQSANGDIIADALDAGGISYERIYQVTAGITDDPDTYANWATYKATTLPGQITTQLAGITTGRAFWDYEPSNVLTWLEFWSGDGAPTNADWAAYMEDGLGVCKAERPNMEWSMYNVPPGFFGLGDYNAALYNPKWSAMALLSGFDNFEWMAPAYYWKHRVGGTSTEQQALDRITSGKTYMDGKHPSLDTIPFWQIRQIGTNYPGQYINAYDHRLHFRTWAEIGQANVCLWFNVNSEADAIADAAYLRGTVIPEIKQYCVRSGRSASITSARWRGMRAQAR